MTTSHLMPDHVLRAFSDYILKTEDLNAPCEYRGTQSWSDLPLMSLAGIKCSGFDFSCPFAGRKMLTSHGNGPVVSRLPGLRDWQAASTQNITPRTMDVETAMLYGRVYNLEFHSWPYPTPAQMSWQDARTQSKTAEVWLKARVNSGIPAMMRPILLTPQGNLCDLVCSSNHIASYYIYIYIHM